MLFSVIVDCDTKGEITVWAQQREKLSPENLEKLTRLLSSIKRVVSNEAVSVELPFPVTNQKNRSVNDSY